MPFKIICCEHSSIQHDARNGFCRACSCMKYEVEYFNNSVIWSAADWVKDDR